MRYVGEPVVAVVAETRELARDASELVEVEYEPLDRARRRAHALGRGRAGPPRRRAARTSCGRASTSGATSTPRSPRRDRVVKIDELHFHRFNSTPLECDGALVEYNRGTGQWTIHTNNQFPGFAAIMMGPAMRVRPRQAALRHAGHRRRLRQQDHVASAARRVLPARAQAATARSSGPSGAPISTSRCRTATSAGSRRPRWRSRTTARCSASARRRSTTPAPGCATSRSAASSGRRSRRACTAGATSASTSRRSRRTRRRCRRTAATRGCSTSGSPSASSTSSRTSSRSTRSRSASATTSAPTRCRTRRRTAASTTPATTR